MFDAREIGRPLEGRLTHFGRPAQVSSRPIRRPSSSSSSSVVVFTHISHLSAGRPGGFIKGPAATKLQLICVPLKCLLEHDDNGAAGSSQIIRPARSGPDRCRGLCLVVAATAAAVVV